MTRISLDLASTVRRLEERTDQPWLVTVSAVVVAIVTALVIAQVIGGSPNGAAIGGLPGLVDASDATPGPVRVGVLDLSGPGEPSPTPGIGPSPSEAEDSDGASGPLDSNASGADPGGGQDGASGPGTVFAPGGLGAPSIPELEPGATPGAGPTPAPVAGPTPPPGTAPTPPPSAGPTPPGALAQCSDGVDNDGDGSTDFPADLGCFGPDDDTEGTFVAPPPTPDPTPVPPLPTPDPTPVPPLPTPDPTPVPPLPTPDPTPVPPPPAPDPPAPQCSDNVDNDGDGFTDTGILGIILGDPDCTGPDDPSEVS